MAPHRRISHQLLSIRTKKLFDLLLNPDKLWIFAVVMLIAEIFVCLGIIWNVPYTEIDWTTYMQQVACFLNGTRNYSEIAGDTGPIVYPVGHLYAYSILYKFTDFGENIRCAQYIFAVFYIVTLALVFRIYHKSQLLPPYILIFTCCTSYRIHSIFVLRLFNDPIAMLLFFIAVNFWISNQWTIGCLFYSLSVSIKMNILLFAPALLFILLISIGLKMTIFNIVFCAIVQILISLPFLCIAPMAYISRSFDFGRVFLYEWTVNWRFLTEKVFLDPRLHVLLLSLHLIVLILFALFCWFRSHGGLLTLLTKIRQSKKCVKLSINEMLLSLFSANFIGIMFSRSLHYQFYCWYFHSLPYLLWSSTLSSPIKVFVMLGIEISWNTFPSSIFSSMLLHILHLVIFTSLLWGRNRKLKRT